MLLVLLAFLNQVISVVFGHWDLVLDYLHGLVAQTWPSKLLLFVLRGFSLRFSLSALFHYVVLPVHCKLEEPFLQMLNLSRRDFVVAILVKRTDPGWVLASLGAEHPVEFKVQNGGQNRFHVLQLDLRLISAARLLDVADNLGPKIHIIIVLLIDKTKLKQNQVSLWFAD